MAGGGELATAELYDPNGESWTATPNMARQRQRHTATLLADGAVMVVGGSESGLLAPTEAELYEASNAT